MHSKRQTLLASPEVVVSIIIWCVILKSYPAILHEAFHIARTGRPGPVVIDIPKNIMNMAGEYAGKVEVTRKSYSFATKGDDAAIANALKLMATAKKPVFYTGGGVINAGQKACDLLTELVELTGFSNY